MESARAASSSSLASSTPYAPARPVRTRSFAWADSDTELGGLIDENTGNPYACRVIPMPQVTASLSMHVQTIIMKAAATPWGTTSHV